MDNNTLTDGSSLLCARCRTIDVGLFHDPTLKVPLRGLHILSLGRPEDFRQLCPLCELFLSVATNHQIVDRLELWLFERVSTKTGGTRVDQRHLTVTRRRIAPLERDPHGIGTGGFLIPVSLTTNHVCPIRLVEPGTIRYDAIIDWLEDCATSHAGFCSQGNESRRSIQLYALDCWTNAIVPLNQNEKYVALSYVWGTAANAARVPRPTPEKDRSVGFQTSEVSLTIRDAMQVVRSINQRYLWVDKYCIVQGNASHRREAISNMDQIYAGAEVTIVALHGDNDGAGLPGVSSIPRSSLQQVCIQNGHVISTLPPLATVLHQSIWSTRGWTYQEARLSRRCLFFSEHQVYFSCRLMTLSEAVPHRPSTSPVANRLNSTGLTPETFAAPGMWLAPVGLFLDRMTYTKRNLSYPQDALDAFKGILRLNPFVTLWGIPVARTGWDIDPYLAFAMGLLWMRRPRISIDSHVIDSVGQTGSRRPGFPTWSWASVTAEIYQDPNYGRSFYKKFLSPDYPDLPDHQMEGIAPRFRVELPGSGTSLAQAVERSTTDLLPETSTSIIIEGEIVKVKRSSMVSSGFFLCGHDGAGIQDLMIRLERDVDTIDEKGFSNEEGCEPQDALIVIEWHDDQPESETRFVLILLRWVGEGIAERLGLLGAYRYSIKKTIIQSVPRRRQRIELR